MICDGYRRYMSSALTKLFIPRQTSRSRRRVACHADCGGRKLVVVMVTNSMSYWPEDTQRQGEGNEWKGAEAVAGVGDGLRVWLPVVIEYLVPCSCCCCRLHTSLNLQTEGASGRARFRVWYGHAYLESKSKSNSNSVKLSISGQAMRPGSRCVGVCVWESVRV